MAVAEAEHTESNGSGSRTALKAAAAAAATGAATFAMRKALSHEDREERDGDSKSSPSKGGQDAGSILSTAASSAWDSASQVVLPMAEDAVAGAGRYLAEHAPEVVRERLVPRFIEAFNEAS